MKEYDSPMNPKMMLQTREIEPFKPEEWLPQMDEIILALPNINRYNGHTKFPYSVAQHSLLCMRVAATKYNLFKPYQRLYFLMHDAAEAYLQDIIRPIKKFSTALNESYMEVEEIITENVMSLIMLQDQVSLVLGKRFQNIAKEIDTRMAVTEVEQLMPGRHNPIPPWTPYDIEIKEFTAREVREQYANAIIENLIDSKEN